MKTNKNIKTSFSILLLILLSPLYADTLEGKVVKVINGSTIQILGPNHQKEEVRLVGIATPERKQPFHANAKDHLISLISNKQVTVEFNKRDKYLSIDGKVISEGKDINLEMIRAGLAWHYKKNQKEQFKLDHKIYAATHSFVKTNGIGLFQEKNMIPPWEWGKLKRKDISLSMSDKINIISMDFTSVTNKHVVCLSSHLPGVKDDYGFDKYLFKNKTKQTEYCDKTFQNDMAKICSSLPLPEKVLCHTLAASYFSEIIVSGWKF